MIFFLFYLNVPCCVCLCMLKAVSSACTKSGVIASWARRLCKLLAVSVNCCIHVCFLQRYDLCCYFTSLIPRNHALTVNGKHYNF